MSCNKCKYISQTQIFNKLYTLFCIVVYIFNMMIKKPYSMKNYFYTLYYTLYFQHYFYKYICKFILHIGIFINNKL